MGTKHRTYSNEFKFKVALAALKGNKTISQLCLEFKLVPSVINRWKATLQQCGPKIFNEKPADLNITELHERETAKLYQQIGQLTVERDFLKKTLNY